MTYRINPDLDQAFRDWTVDSFSNCHERSFEVYDMEMVAAESVAIRGGITTEYGFQSDTSDDSDIWYVLGCIKRAHEFTAEGNFAFEYDRAEHIIRAAYQNGYAEARNIALQWAKEHGMKNVSLPEPRSADASAQEMLSDLQALGEVAGRIDQDESDRVRQKEADAEKHFYRTGQYVEVRNGPRTANVPNELKGARNLSELAPEISAILSEKPGECGEGQSV